MSNKSGASEQIISLPKGGGALKGIGETFSPDLHTGTGNFTVPIALPPGRNGFQPQLNLVYSTGNGNGPFGLGWGLSVPGVSRKTSKGVPRYHNYDPKEQPDVFVLSGAEDLVPVEEDSVSGITRYRPRTEGLFALIEHHHRKPDDYWKVHSKDGLVSCYGTSGSAGQDSAVISDPANRDHVFAWKLTATEDPFGNRIEYEYQRDSGQDGPHSWDQLYLKEIRYVDYPDRAGKTQFLVRVSFEYQDHPSPFSEYRSGFEIRTRLRCKCIHVCTYPDGKNTLPATGRFDWEASADIREAANLGDEYRFTLFFTIVLVRPASARLTKFQNGCTSAGIAAAGGQCQGRVLVPQVISPDWELLAVGVRGFRLEGGAGAPPSGILLQSLAMDASRWRPSGSDLVAYLGCEMHDMTPTEPMSCEMEGVALAVASGEAFQARFSSSDLSVQSFGANTATPPPGLPVDGGFGGLARFSLTFGAAEAQTWSWAADYNDIVICPNMTDFCYNRIGFLAGKFGSNVNNLPFTVENSGFAVWTRPWAGARRRSHEGSSVRAKLAVTLQADGVMARTLLALTRQPACSLQDR